MHSMILEAYKVKDFGVFPEDWGRLDPESTKGGSGFRAELGERGQLITAFTEDGRPVACSGVMPWRGPNWVNDAFYKSDEELASARVASNGDSIPDWEICCFCVYPSQRGKGLSYKVVDKLMDVIRPLGAKRLLTNYAIDETGDFWPRLGFETIPGAGGSLPKGFQRDPEKEGLRETIWFRMGGKAVT